MAIGRPPTIPNDYMGESSGLILLARKITADSRIRSDVKFHVASQLRALAAQIMSWPEGVASGKKEKSA